MHGLFDSFLVSSSSIDDEAWTDRLDKHTGAVFYVSPADSPGKSSGTPRNSHRRSLSVGDLATYSTSSPGHSIDGPEHEGVNLSSQSRGTRRHILGRMYGSLKKKATRASSQERQGHSETVSHDVNTVNVSGLYEGPRLKPALPPSLGLQTKTVHPRSSIEGMSATLMQFVKGQAAESRYVWREYGHLYHAVLYVTLDVDEEASDNSKVKGHCVVIAHSESCLMWSLCSAITTLKQLASLAVVAEHGTVVGRGGGGAAWGQTQ